MTYAFIRGHLVIYEDDKWIYYDTKQPTDFDNRPCKKCNCPPTKEGHDACLGKLDGVRHACCGHGIDNGYIIKEDGTVLDDVWDRVNKQREIFLAITGK